MQKKTKHISLTEYVNKINPAFFRTNRRNPTANITEEAVRNRIRNNKELPDVIRAEKIGKVHVLIVDINF